MKKKGNLIYHQISQPRMLTASIEKVQELGQKHYKEAMKHMKKFNQYESNKKAKMHKQEPLNQECTFYPKSFTNSYHHTKPRPQKDPVKGLMKWHKQKNDKLLQKTVNRSVQYEKERVDILKSSLSRSKRTQRNEKRGKQLLQNNLSFASTYNSKPLGYYSKKAMKSGSLSTNMCLSCRNSATNFKSSESLFNN